MGQITVTLHNYRSRQVHETLNRVNPSSSFRDMRSAKSGTNLWQICGKFLARGQAHMGQMGKWPWQCATTGLDNPTELRMEKIHQAVRDMGSASLARTPKDRPPARTVTTIPLQPGGLRGKNGTQYKGNIFEGHNSSQQYAWNMKHDSKFLFEHRLPCIHRNLRYLL